jgi:predicted nucleotidyltransferase
MKLPSYFDRFLAEIEPSPSYKQDQQDGHRVLRRRLAEDDEFGEIHLNTFLQGSYKRQTAIHPGKDVDIVVVTSLDPDWTTPQEANKKLRKCLDKHYKGKIEPQNRSLCITLSYVRMDVVLATSRYLERQLLRESITEAKEIEDVSGWKQYPLLIPDRELGAWVDTHPKKQLEWTTGLNETCGGYFVPLVKMFKWWRKEAYTTPKHPRSYVLERLAGECVDTSIRDHAENFVSLLQNIVIRYSLYASAGVVPTLPDPGVPANNVARRLSVEDFKRFMKEVEAVLPTAEAALGSDDKGRSAELWRKVFGDKFPAAPAVNADFPDHPVRPNKPAGFA